MIIKSRTSAMSTFHRSLQPVKVDIRLCRTSSNAGAAEKINFDGTISVLELIGYRPIFVAIARESVQYLSQQVINARNFIKEAYTKFLPYKNVFYQWMTRLYLNLRRNFASYALNRNNKKPVTSMTVENNYDDLYDEDIERYSDRFDDYDARSLFSNADTDISSPPHGKDYNPSKVAELENEVLILKQQLTLILSQMNIAVPPVQTPSTTSTSPPPPPPLPANLLKPTEIVINRSKPAVPESSSNATAVPRITEILGDLTKVQLRHVPRSPGGTPCRNRVLSAGDSMADAVKNAMDKRRKDFDISLDESGLNDSWEEEDKEN